MLFGVRASRKDTAWAQPTAVWLASKKTKLPEDLNRIIYLTEDLHLELNILVSQLNNVVEAAVNDADSETGRGTAVQYVDVQKKFDSHRWLSRDSWAWRQSTNTYFFKLWAT